MVGHRRMPSDAVPLASPAGQLRSPAWMAVPDDDDEEATEVRQFSRGVSASAWWMAASLAILVLLLTAQSELVPWWLVAVVAAEAYASGRRMFFQEPAGAAGSQDARVFKRQRRLRHFTSARLKPSAPVDELLARFLALDELGAVRSIELGSNSSTERLSRGHTLGLMATFAGTAERDAFLTSPERAAFLSFAEPHVEEWYAFDFESGVVLT